MKLTHLVAIAAMLVAAPLCNAQLATSPPIPVSNNHPVPAIQDTETAAQKDARMAW